MRSGIMSLESVAFQSTSFFDDLTRIVTELRQTPALSESNQLYTTPLALELLSSIKAHTGLTVVYDQLQPSGPPCMIFPVYTINHALIAQDERETLGGLVDVHKAVARMKEGYRGTIDLRQAKVTGDFARIVHLLYLPGELLTQGLWLGKPFSARETAAMMLHEVGHAFVNLEYMNRVVTTNQVLHGVSQGLMNNQPENVQLVISTAALRMQASADQVVALKAVKTQADATVVLAAIAVDQSRSELGYSVFDETSMETLCDQFAARHGAARDLAMALAKVSVRNPQATYWRDYFLDLGTFALFSLIAIPAALIVGLTYRRQRDSYGTFHNRLSRLRGEIVAQLKDRTLGALEKTQTLNALREVDAVLDIESNSLSFYEGLLYLINGEYRANRKYELLQRQLETYAHNTFFAHAAKISSL